MERAEDTGELHARVDRARARKMSGMKVWPFNPLHLTLPPPLLAPVCDAGELLEGLAGHCVFPSDLDVQIQYLSKLSLASIGNFQYSRLRSENVVFKSPMPLALECQCCIRIIH